LATGFSEQVVQLLGCQQFGKRGVARPLHETRRGVRERDGSDFLGRLREGQLVLPLLAVRLNRGNRGIVGNSRDGPRLICSDVAYLLYLTARDTNCVPTAFGKETLFEAFFLRRDTHASVRLRLSGGRKLPAGADLLCGHRLRLLEGAQ